MEHGIKRDKAEFSPFEKLAKAFKLGVPNLWGAIHDKTGGKLGVICTSVTIMIGREGDWIAIAKGWTPDTLKNMVAFGAGADFLTALENLNKSLSAGRWREDAKFTKRT